MQNEIYKEIKTYLNIKEKILFTMFRKTFVKVYNIGRTKGVNALL